MSVIYGSQTKVVHIRRAAIKISGNTLATGRQVTAQWGNAIVETPVIGADIPLNYTGQFKGTINIEYLYCTDLVLATLVDPDVVTGQIPETTILEELTDTQAVAKKDTWSFVARLHDAQITGRAGDFIIATVSGVLTARPTRSQA